MPGEAEAETNVNLELGADSLLKCFMGKDERSPVALSFTACFAREPFVTRGGPGSICFVCVRFRCSVLSAGRVVAFCSVYLFIKHILRSTRRGAFFLQLIRWR